MFERMLVAVDGSPHSARVVATARDLAVKCSSKVLVAHIRDVGLPVTMAAAAGRPGAMLRRDTTALEDEDVARHVVDDALAVLREGGLADVKGEVGSAWGATARELLALADGFGANVIVVGSQGWQVTQMLLGSVAYRIVHQASCPVLVVR